MKISYNWLKNYLKTDLPPETAAALLTGCGLEVEGIERFESIKGGLRGVVIGEVLTCEKHPGSDHLSLTTVNVGTEQPLKIVCGAPNVAAGQKVVVATLGTTLCFGDKEVVIKEAKIRGELSQGMICAEDELGLGTSHAGIMVLEPDAVPGTLASDHFKVEEDHVFEIGLTPNRTDATSHIGVARDLAAVLNNREEWREAGEFRLLMPDVSGFTPDNKTAGTRIIIGDPGACPRYSGLVIRNVRVGESPDWLKNRLNSIKLRPINNVVDITNFVLHETGHPLHAFDADKIAGDKVIIKKLPGGTHFVTLDGVDRELSDQDLMICDENGAMCMAGIFGGIHSGVTENTRNLFLESAYFDPKTVRRSSKLHGLQTDASFRFERGANFDITVYALKRAAMMIREIAGGEIASDVMDVYPEPIPYPVVKLTYEGLDRLTGTVIDRDLVRNILVSLGITIQSETSLGLTLQIPPFKADVLREADVIEEILRIYSYDKIGFSPEIRSSISHSEKPEREKVQNVVSDFLTSNGFYEILNNSITKSSSYATGGIFNSENLVMILNPLSADLDCMRQTLLYGGLETITYNQNRKVSDVRFYEFGNVYTRSGNKTGTPLSEYHEEKHLALFISGKIQGEQWNVEQRNANFFDLKGYLLAILARTGIPEGNLVMKVISDEIFSKGITVSAANEEIAKLGTLHPELLRKFDCRQEVFYADVNWDRLVKILPRQDIRYSAVPKFPEVRRDLALLLDRGVTFRDIEQISFETERHLLKKVSLFDVYEGDKIGKDKKSYALSFILQDPDKTLKDEEIDRVMNRLMKAFREKLSAGIR